MQITRLTLTHKNINEVIQLIKQTFLEFVAPDYDESGIKNFFKFAEDEELLKKLLFYAALHDDKITGILAVDDKVNHICLFFVDKAFQNTGIGSALFKKFLNESIPKAVTVNSSPFAVNIYEKLGFTATSSRQVSDGIVYIPMRYSSKQLQYTKQIIFSVFYNEVIKVIKILFICLGNICRSPMAEFLFKDMVAKRGLADKFYIASAATSSYEIGNPVHSGTRNKLAQYGISVAGKTAVQLTKADYNKYDYLIGMEASNIRNILRIVGSDSRHKVYKLLQFAGSERDIADPWYTGNFDVTYNDSHEGCTALLEYLLKNKTGV